MPITYTRKHTSFKRHVIDLTVARTEIIIDLDLTGVLIVDKGAGAFTLTFEFPDKTRETLTQAEAYNGMLIECDIANLFLTNAAQPGQTLRLIAYKQQKPYLTE